MKANQNPRRARSTPQVFEFLQRRPENILRVENHETGVRIRATRDNFSERDKAYFVRYLADEGFIPVPRCYRWSSDDCGVVSGIEWNVGESCGRTDSQALASSSRATVFMIRLLTGATFLLLIQFAFLFLKSR